MNLFRDTQVMQGKIWTKWVYNLSYDKKMKRFTCECQAFCFRGSCYHIKEFEKMLKEADLIETERKDEE